MGGLKKVVVWCGFEKWEKVGRGNGKGAEREKANKCLV